MYVSKNDPSPCALSIFAGSPQSRGDSHCGVPAIPWGFPLRGPRNPMGFPLAMWNADGGRDYRAAAIPAICRRCLNTSRAALICVDMRSNSVIESLQRRACDPFQSAQPLRFRQVGLRYIKRHQTHLGSRQIRHTSHPGRAAHPAKYVGQYTVALEICAVEDARGAEYKSKTDPTHRSAASSCVPGPKSGPLAGFLKEIAS